MAILAPIFQRRNLALNDPKAWHPSLWNLWGRQSSAGVTVSEESAMSVGAVFRCIKVISDAVASLPLKLYKKDLNNGGREEVSQRQIVKVLHNPNPEMSGYRLRHVMQGHLCSWGNFYCYVKRDKLGRVLELWPLRPDKMRLEREGVALLYIYNTKEGQVAMTSREILHVPGFGFDGMRGYSVVGLAREAIGLGMATEEFGARYFSEGQHPGVIVKHPMKLSAEGYQNLKLELSKKMKGLGKSHDLLLLEEGMDAMHLGLPHDDAQFLETRKFQVVDICRFFGVPPHMVYDLERATFSNIEEQSREWVRDGLGPWAKLWEKELGRYFLSGNEIHTTYFEHKLDALLRGKTLERYQSYASALQWGWMSPNEVRQLENLNPVDELDIHMIPMNMIPADQLDDEPEPLPEPLALPPPEPEEEGRKHWLKIVRTKKETRKSAAARRRISKSYWRLFKHAANSIVQREIMAIKRVVNKYLTERNVSEFSGSLEDFYKTLPDYVDKKLGPVVRSFAEAIQVEAAKEIGADEGMTPELETFVDDYLAIYSQRHISASMGQMDKLAEEWEAESLGEAVTERVDEWGETRAEKIANNETVRANNAITREVWFLAGITILRWAAFGDKPCPYCLELNGKKVGIENPFVRPGNFQPTGQEPMRIRQSHFHPPLHQGCECDIIAG